MSSFHPLCLIIAILLAQAMAWLLHEPRLVAKVPVFCIIGVKPLLRNGNAPMSVSTGAVHLLLHLHSRLEVRMHTTSCTTPADPRCCQVLIRADDLDEHAAAAAQGGAAVRSEVEDHIDGSDTSVLWEVSGVMRPGEQINNAFCRRAAGYRFSGAWPTV